MNTTSNGTLLIFVHNLDQSGANQVILNLIQGGIQPPSSPPPSQSSQAKSFLLSSSSSKVVVCCPKNGPFEDRLLEIGVTVLISSDIAAVIDDIKDVSSVIANTIMAAEEVVKHKSSKHRDIPIFWIIHEYWNEKLLIENLKMRNIQTLTIDTVRRAFNDATRAVFVCEAQKRLFFGEILRDLKDDNSVVIYCGTPSPSSVLVPTNSRPFIFLVIGIICPRKNQLWAVELFKEFKRKYPKANAKLILVGARYTRDYEMAYTDLIRDAISKPEQVSGTSIPAFNWEDYIEIHDLTDDVATYYRESDCLMMVSDNEVTPLVLLEAMSHRLPSIATSIAGVPEMLSDGHEGFLIVLNDSESALRAMKLLYDDQKLRTEMGERAYQRYSDDFNLNTMVQKYRKMMSDCMLPLARNFMASNVSPFNFSFDQPRMRILVDMDGVMADWDRSFMIEWTKRHPEVNLTLDRRKSFNIEQCIIESEEIVEMATALYHREGFFETLIPIKGSIDAVLQMEKIGIDVKIVTSPILSSRYCAQEKLNWVAKYLGESWLNKVVICSDKTVVNGDILIDDNPVYQTISNVFALNPELGWSQVIFDQPYNRHIKSCTRLSKWENWESVILPLLENIRGGNRTSSHTSHASSAFAASTSPSAPTSNRCSQNTYTRSQPSSMSSLSDWSLNSFPSQSTLSLGLLSSNPSCNYLNEQEIDQDYDEIVNLMRAEEDAMPFKVIIADVQSSPASRTFPSRNKSRNY